MNKPRKKEIVIYENEQWRVTNLFFETLDESYWFDVDRLTDLRYPTQYPDWPIHLAGKRWVDIPLFMDAFRAAVAHHCPEAFTAEILDLVEMKAIAKVALGDAYMLAFSRWHERHYGEQFLPDKDLRALEPSCLNADFEFMDLWDSRDKHG